MPLTNHQVRLAARPSGLPRATDWSLTTEEVPEPAEGQFVVAVSHLSVDPAMRGWLKEGDTVVVSGAAGAVGSMAGQIATIKGAGRVIGIAGGPEKCRALTEEFGFDAAIDYRAGNVRRALREHTPDGVDVYFDNVGGEILDDVLTRLARGARVGICGAVSQYNETQVRGPANYLMLLVARASMTGMLVFDFADRYPQAMAELAGWLRDGKIVSREHVVHGGVDAFPQTLLMLFDGVNTGKLVLALDGG